MVVQLSGYTCHGKFSQESVLYIAGKQHISVLEKSKCAAFLGSASSLPQYLLTHGSKTSVGRGCWVDKVKRHAA